MRVKQILRKFQEKYPNKKIIKNDDNNPTEILCEVESSSEHPDYSIAVAVIEKSKPHYHKKTTEIYEAIKGKLILNIDGKEIILKSGQSLIINPSQVHFALGKDTWVKVTSRPGWKIEDHWEI